jgi:Ca2+-dependent lipid-binding protein
MIRGKRVSKKKTSIKRTTLSPVFNEPFLFDPNPCNVTSHDVSLLFLVMDRHAMRQNNVIGKVEVGLKCSQMGVEHWKAMATNPGRQIARWHRLSPCIKRKDRR